MDAAVELHHSLKSDTATSVRWDSVLEGVDVLLDGVDWDLVYLRPLS